MIEHDGVGLAELRRGEFSMWRGVEMEMNAREEAGCSSDPNYRGLRGSGRGFGIYNDGGCR